MTLLRSCGAGDAAYDAFVHRHGRRHGSAEEYEGRRQVFHDNRAKIDGWNAAGGAHECALQCSAQLAVSWRQRVACTARDKACYAGTIQRGVGHAAVTGCVFPAAVCSANLSALWAL